MNSDPSREELEGLAWWHDLSDTGRTYWLEVAKGTVADPSPADRGPFGVRRTTLGALISIGCAGFGRFRGPDGDDRHAASSGFRGVSEESTRDRRVHSSKALRCRCGL